MSALVAHTNISVERVQIAKVILMSIKSSIPLSSPYPFPFPWILLLARVLTQRAYDRPFRLRHVDWRVLALAIQDSKGQDFDP